MWFPPTEHPPIYVYAFCVCLAEFSIGSNDADERGQSLTITEGKCLWKYWEDGLSKYLLQVKIFPTFWHTTHTFLSTCSSTQHYFMLFFFMAAPLVDGKFMSCSSLLILYDSTVWLTVWYLVFLETNTCFTVHGVNVTWLTVFLQNLNVVSKLIYQSSCV